MAWKQTDYNLNTIHKKSRQSINAEYQRMRKMVQRRVATFEKHSLGNIPQIREMKEILQNPNKTRRQREMAIMEFRRFSISETSSYTKYVKSLEDTMETFRGMGVSVNKQNIGEFLSFLDWVKSFTSYNYEINSVKVAWKQAKGNVEGAMEMFRALQTPDILRNMKKQHSEHNKIKVQRFRNV